MPRSAGLTKVNGLHLRLWPVANTDEVTSWASAPTLVRLPPHTLRFTIGTRKACSPRWLHGNHAALRQYPDDVYSPEAELRSLFVGPGFAAVDHPDVQRMVEHERNRVVIAQVGWPVPGELALGPARPIAFEDGLSLVDFKRRANYSLVFSRSVTIFPSCWRGNPC